MNNLLIILILSISQLVYSQAQDSIDCSRNFVITNNKTGGKLMVTNGEEIRILSKTNSTEQTYIGDFIIVNDSTLLIDSSVVKISEIKAVMISNDKLINGSKVLKGAGFTMMAIGGGLLIYSATLDPSEFLYGVTKIINQVAGGTLIILSAVPISLSYRMKKGKKYRQKKWGYSIE